MALDKVRPQVNEAVQFLKECDDFTTIEAYKHIETIQNYTHPEGTPCDDPVALSNHISEVGFDLLFPKMWDALFNFFDVKQVDTQGFKNVNMLSIAFTALSMYSPEICASLGKCGAIPKLFEGAEKAKSFYVNQKPQSDVFQDTRDNILIILINAIRLCSDNRVVYRNNNAVALLKSYLEIDEVWRLYSLTILAYVVNDAESEVLAASKESVQSFTNLLKDAVASEDHVAHAGVLFSAEELLDAINHLAINDDIKKVVAEEGTIPSIIRMLDEDFSPEERRTAAEGLWNMAFIESIRKSDLIQGTIPILKRMTKTKDKDLRGACSSALFQIQGDVDTTPSPSVSEAAPPSYQEAMSEPKSSSASTSAQVMVSYQWDSQTRAIMIRDKLLQAGYKVWMDLTNMRGNILGSMADGVQKSDVILMCMTERYKDSKSCRTEASYAYKLDKKIVPLLLEDGYKPDGWLGILQGMDLYYALHSDEQLEQNFGELLKVLGETTGLRAVIVGAEPSKSSEKTETKPAPKASGKGKDVKSSARDWSRDDVQTWLKDNELTELCETFKKFNGKHLKKLYDRYNKDEDKFEEELKSDYKLENSKICTEFIVALEDAFEE